MEPFRLAGLKYENESPFCQPCPENTRPDHPRRTDSEREQDNPWQIFTMERPLDAGPALPERLDRVVHPLQAVDIVVPAHPQNRDQNRRAAMSAEKYVGHLQAAAEGLQPVVAGRQPGSDVVVSCS